MPIKRYAPKYKKLKRFKHPLNYENALKINGFLKQKWDDHKKSYFPRKYKFYNQDKSAYLGSKNFEENRSTRLKKVYKFLLIDKQRFQRYYGGGRIRHYQIKALARKAFRLTKNTKLTPVKSALSLLENRLQTILYHLRLAPSLMDARHMILSDRLKVSGELVDNCSKILKKSDLVSMDPVRLTDIIRNYLLQTNLLYYFRSKQRRRRLLFKKRKTFLTSVVLNNSSLYYKSYKGLVNYRLYKFKNIKPKISRKLLLEKLQSMYEKTKN